MPLFRFTSGPGRLITYHGHEGFRAAVYALEVEVIGQVARGYFWTLRYVPGCDNGELIVEQRPLQSRVVGVSILACIELQDMMFRCEFTTELPQPIGPGSFEDLLRLWTQEMGSDGAATKATFDREGKFRLS